MVYHSWPLARSRGPRPLLRSRFRPGRRRPLLLHDPPPLRSTASPTRPIRGIHFPTNRSLASSHRRGPCSPRRGLPHPLRSAFAVSHDRDGFRLLEPCGVFRPLTPLRFASPSPRLIALPDKPEDLTDMTRGAGCVTGGSRLPRVSSVPKYLRSSKHRSDRRNDRSGSGSPHVSASRHIRHPSACADVRPMAEPPRVAPVRPPRWQASSTRSARPHCRGCLSRASRPSRSVLTLLAAGPAGNRPLRACLRSRPGLLSKTRPLASAEFPAAALPIHPEGYLRRLALGSSSEDSLNCE
jgi:hypothetical protein